MVKTIFVSTDTSLPIIMGDAESTTRNITIDEIKHPRRLYFNDAHNLFGLYHNILENRLDKQQNKICWEIREKLFNLDSHVRRIKYLNSKITNPISTSEEESIIHSVYSTELWDSVELFYYRAHRLIKIISALPELGKVNARGVTMVRNWLIEHSEKSSQGSLEQSISIGKKNGPILKPPILPSSKVSYRDKGLLVNAFELRQSLSLVLNDWVAKNKSIISQHALTFGYPSSTRKMYLKIVEGD